MYKVFINDKTLIITDKPEKEKSTKTHIVKEYTWDKDIDLILNELETKKTIKSAELVGEKEDKLWKTFEKKFTVIEAAGGLVYNDEGKFLFIFRNGKWDLPKGKIEPGEPTDVTAKREIKEETGVEELKLRGFLPESYHMYKDDNGKWILKINYWFKFLGKAEKLTPQKEEGIEKAEWLTKKEVKEMALKNTYPSLIPVIKEGIEE
ncbi:MAG TPA: NUDIX hydrolase [Flavobacteriales bacterium]|nr:NUDIX hydrolase [Flavobacteriales bacterium]|tara:strand:+ start:10276 stop:10893 length:618 start_codon:yes stop_codon:yes gene_type:complete